MTDGTSARPAFDCFHFTVFHKVGAEEIEALRRSVEVAGSTDEHGSTS